FLALQRGFHERTYLQGFLRTYRRYTCFEKLNYLYQQRVIPSKIAYFRNTLFTEDRPAILLASLVDTTESSHPSVIPGTNYDIRVWRRNLYNRFTASSHHRKQRLYTMNTVPE